MHCVPETAGRRRREAARWSDEAEAAAAAAKGRGRRRRAIVARDLEKTRSTAGGGIERLLALSCHQGRSLDLSGPSVCLPGGAGHGSARWETFDVHCIYRVHNNNIIITIIDQVFNFDIKKFRHKVCT